VSGSFGAARRQGDDQNHYDGGEDEHGATEDPEALSWRQAREPSLDSRLLGASGRTPAVSRGLPAHRSLLAKLADSRITGAKVLEKTSEMWDTHPHERLASHPDGR
jgi:hypothetical protein